MFLIPTLKRFKFNSKKLIIFFIYSLLAFSQFRCVESGGGSSAALGSNQLLASNDPVLKIHLIDAPNHNLKSVFVNVDHMELFLAKGGVEKRLIIGQGLGPVDLLQLQNGVMLPLADFQMPEGIEVREVRLVLNNDGNYAVRQDDSICEMQTPSGQQSGVKIKLGTAFTVEQGYEYSLVVDFDAKKSIVIKGNGGCLLKPVIRIPAVTRQLIAIVDPPADPEDPTIPDDPTTPADPEPVTDGDDTNTTDPDSPTYLDENGDLLTPEELGFDPHDPTTYPDGVTIEDLYMYF